MASKKPKGLTITRKNGKYIFKWKKGETYADGERLIWGYVQVTTSGNKSTKTRWESGTVKLSGSKTDYTVNVPVTYTDIAYVYFKVRGKANGEAWSDWESETFKLKDPKEPSVSASWDSGTPNKTSFSFTAQDEDHQPYNHIEWQTILVENCPSDYKAASLWKGATKHTKSGTSGTFYNTPESALTGSWARIVRARAVGQGGASDWRYAWHVYAQPNAPYNVTVDAEYDATNQATDLTVKWDAMAPAMQRPIDTTKVQYCIGVPTSGFGLPTGASWTDVATPVNTALNVWETRLGAEIDLDECLFVRVVTVHDTHEVGSTFVCAYKRELTAPVLGTITPTKSTHTIAVAVTNGSQNPDSKTAITYRDPATGKIGVVGVIAHGGTSMNVLVPAWEDSAGTIGAFAFVGDSSQQKSTPYYVYSVNSVVESDTVWATATRTAPTITAVIKDETTVNVAWNWPWADATNAELSWADRSDAWESTNQPTTYVVNNNQQASWNITGLDEGKVYYFRVRLFYGENDENFYSDYSNTAVVDMTQPPEKPVLELSDTIVPVDGTITASWQNYEKQTYAELIETVSGVDTVRAEVASGSSVEFSPEDFGWSNDSGHILSVKVYLDGTGSLKSDTVAVNVASALECVIAQDSLVYEEQELNPETYTGNPAHFDGGSDNVKEITSLEVPLTPKQAGTPWQDSTIYQTPYLLKQVPAINHSINSEFNTLVGVSVVKNQIVPIPSSSKSITNNGITFVDNRDGSYTISTASGGATASTNIDIDYMSIPKGHKVFIIGSYANTSVSTHRWFLTSSGSNTYFNNGDSVYNIVDNTVSLKLSVMSGDTISTAQTRKPSITDLTQRFGSTVADFIYTQEQNTAGAGVALCRMLGINGYEAFNTGTLVSSTPTAHKTVGFNQWDEEWELGDLNTTNGSNYPDNNRIRSKNYVRIMPSTTYYFKCPNNATVCYYDADKNYITTGNNTLTANSTFTSATNAYYMRFAVSSAYGTTYNNNICINVSKTTGTPKNGDYVAHESSTYNLGSDTLRGLLTVDNGSIKAVGDVKTPDGTITRNYGQVDLGTLEWVRDPNLMRFYAAIPTSYAPEADAVYKAICPLYQPIAFGNIVDTSKDMVMAMSSGLNLTVRNLAYHPDQDGAAATFKTAMSGVMLTYELATPTTATGTAYDSPQTVYAGGTEEYTEANNVPVGNQTRYADVYEITGTDEVTVNVEGKNLADMIYDGTVPSINNGALVAYHGTHSQYIPVISDAAYACTFGLHVFNVVVEYDADKNFIKATQNPSTITTTTTTKFIMLRCDLPSGDDTVPECQLEHGTTATAYTPYIAGDNSTTALGQTVYEGTLDVVKGKLTDGTNDLDMGDLNWVKVGGYDHVFYAELTGGSQAASPYGICSDYPLTATSSYTTNNQGRLYGSTQYSFSRIAIRDDEFSDAASFKVHVAGMQLVYELKEPLEYDLTPTQIQALLGDNYVWSEQGTVTVRIADAVESGYYLDELPLTVTVTGAGTAGNTTMKIVRAENYAMERPDGKDYNGYEGDLIVQKVQSGEDQMTIDLTNLVGRFDDGAKYRIVATIQDELGQRSEAVKDFTVQWSHQAVIATGTAVIDGDIAKITPTKPNGAIDDDYVDVYRLSCDAPELIFSHANFGDTVVDPYPTLGDTGGYRLVLVTKNGDYITEDNLPSWVDVKAGLTTQYQYIDFDGERLPLKYNVKLDETKQKTFDVTHYLGGSVQGDFLEGTEGSGTVNGTIPYMLDPADFITLRDLMRYTGLCHVRTKIGSNYVANVEVQDGSSHDGPGGMHDASLAITQVDNPELDGVLLTDWQVS